MKLFSLHHFSFFNGLLKVKYEKSLFVLMWMCCIAVSSRGQSLDFQSAIYFTASGNTLTSSDEDLSAFDFSSANTTHPLFNDGLYYPVKDYLGKNIWVRVRYTAADPNGVTVGHNVTSTTSSPFRSGGFGGWGGFLYQFDIFQDANLTGTPANTLNGSFKSTILVESIETLSDTEWVFFQITDDNNSAWVLNSIDFTGVNPDSNPGFSGSNIPYNSNGFSTSFPVASNTVSVIDLPSGGFSEFSISANSVTQFLYGYEYGSGGGYQGMRLSFGTAPLLPTIISFTPASGQPGTTVTITGTNFDPVAANNVVKFNGATAVVAASTTTSITTTVPAGATTGKITVTIGNDTATSATDFTVIVPNQPPMINAATATIPAKGTATFNLLQLITDADNNLNLSSLAIVQSPVSGAIATINSQGVLTVNYAGNSFLGQDRLTIQVCDTQASCMQQEITIDVVDVVVYNALSPNGDLKNDFLFIQYIDELPDTKKNHVSILNRWGDVVFEVDDYNNADRAFKGMNSSGKELATGTYYYQIRFASGRDAKSGFIYLKH